MSWPVVYYQAADRSEPVNDEIDALPVKVQVAIDNQIERLGLFGPDHGFPYKLLNSGNFASDFTRLDQLR